MINLFRKIRRQLANENKFQRYMRYAVGEVLLIMLGIFMALQLQNWNEKRKQEIRFKATLEQLYTTINYDVEKFKRDSIAFTIDIMNLDTLISYPERFNNIDLPYIVNGLIFNPDPYTSESIYHSQQLNYDPDNKEQKEIAKEIIKYINEISNYGYLSDDRMRDAIREIDIPLPKINFNDINSYLNNRDTTYYTQFDLKNLQDLIGSHSFKAILKNVKTLKTWNWSNSRNWHGAGVSIRKLIKEFYPDVKELYKNVGIIGTSINGFDDVGAKSTPMTLVNEEQNIWELNLYLKVGRLKFRCNDSWTQNWGDSVFPKGIGIQDGFDIPIPEAGNYHIIFKPVTGEYEFIKQEDLP